MFNYPTHLDYSVVSELENHVIEILNTCPNIDSLVSTAQPLYAWAGNILQKHPDELRHDLFTHETHEHYPNLYLQEKDHLLKLPLILLEKINN